MTGAWCTCPFIRLRCELAFNRGAPVLCDNPALIIEFTKLSDKPEYRVAVNNPTDQPIRTVLRQGIALPGFKFPDTPVEVPAGAYLVVAGG